MEPVFIVMKINLSHTLSLAKKAFARSAWTTLKWGTLAQIVT
jgi:hypothetical protein